MTSYRGRFAPSPTGPLHLGTARTALVAWLRARQAGGNFILRLEDLDLPRVRPGAQAALLTDLAWLGLDWDEGPDKGGPCGPYEQGKRLAHYQAALDKLRAAGPAYPCTCTRSEFAGVASAPQGPEGPAYPGTCRSGPSHPGRPAAWRLRMQRPEPFDDALAGPQAGAAQDVVLQRADGVFSYQLACAVDDAAMGVSEVVRGDDLLASTAWQIAILRALGSAVPAYLHVPLLRGPDGQRLAKRHGSVAVADYRAAGWSPRRVLGALAASLGLGKAGGDADPAGLLGRFSLTALRFSDTPGPWA